CTVWASGTSPNLASPALAACMLSVIGAAPHRFALTRLFRQQRFLANLYSVAIVLPTVWVTISAEKGRIRR
ncbi:MAG: hypothetical protein ACLPXZ_15445, partial [Mycobacterium sp.]